MPSTATVTSQKNTNLLVMTGFLVILILVGLGSSQFPRGNTNVHFPVGTVEGIKTAQVSCSLPTSPSVIDTQVTITPDNVDGIVNCSGSDIIVGSTGEIVINSQVTVDGSLTGDYGITLLVGSLTVQSGGKITADGKGYQVGQTESGTGTPSSPLGETGGSGGGHGGVGGEGITDGVNNPTTAGQQYGNPSGPVTLGSPGSNAGNGAVAGAGGGALKVVSTGAVTINGQITANGTEGAVVASSSGGGGSGGSIWIDALSFSGNGLVSSNGGGAAPAQYQGGGGGGGRIFMLCHDSNSFIGSTLVSGGSTSSSQDGGDGSKTGPSCVPSNPVTLRQYESNQTTNIPVNGLTNDSTVILAADMHDPDSTDRLYLQVEVRALGTAFTNIPTNSQTGAGSTNPQNCNNPLTDCGRLTISGLTRAREYHWQARVVDSNGFSSSWVSFGGNGENERDFLLSGPAAQLTQVSGNGQSGVVGTNLAAPLKIRITDGGGFPVQGQTVTWSVPAAAGGGALLGASTTSTNANGETENTYKLGTQVGTNNNTVRATVGSITGSPSDFTASGLVGALDHFSLQGPQVALTNTNFSLTITAYDQYSNVKTDYAGTVSLAAVEPTDSNQVLSGSLSVTSVAFTGSENGAKTISNIAYDTVDSIRIKGSDSGNTGLTNIIAIVNSIGTCPDADGIIDSNQTWTATVENQGVFDCRDVPAVHISASAKLSLTPYNNDNNNAADDIGVTILANSIVVDSGSTIGSDAVGYIGLSGWAGGTGGSYGGYGAYNDSNYLPRVPYGNVYEPADLGGGGNATAYAGPSRGGGAIKLISSADITVNGAIQSLGQDNLNGGGGAGGSVFLDSQTIAGSGTVSTNGGAGIASGFGVNGGSGGRTAIYYDSGDPSSLSITSYGGTGTSANGNGAAGTIYIEHKGVDLNKAAKLYIDNNNHYGGFAVLPEATYNFSKIYMTRYGYLSVLGQGSILEIPVSTVIAGDNTKSQLLVNGTFKYLNSDPLSINGVNLNINGELTGVQNINVGDGLNSELTLNANTWAHNKGNQYSFSDVNVNANGVITMVGYDNGDSDYTNDYGVSMNATNVTVASGGYIHANYLGYRSAGGPGMSSGDGRGEAGYGGYGGGNGGSVSGTAYGSVYEPTDLGSRSNRAYEGGGGAIKLTVSNKFTNNGAIQSNGGGAWEYWAGGSSGGSIWINTKTIAGSGVISARGGIKTSNGAGDYQGSGGAGGRIAVYYEDVDGTSPFSFDTAHINAYGTNSWGSSVAGAGTVYYKQMTGGVDTWTSDARKNGNLLIDNNNQPGSSAGLVSANYTFNQVKLNRYGHLTVEGDQNGGVLEVSDGSSLVGDATKPSLTVNGKLRYTGSGDLGVNGVDLGINGEIEMVNNDNLVIGDSLAAGVTMYAHTWAHNKTNGYSFGDVTVGVHGIMTMVGYDNGDGDYTNDYGVSLNATNVTVASGGYINANELGYRYGAGPGVSTGDGHAASGYGGYGASNYPAGGGATYGSVYEPTDLGSRALNGGSGSGGGGGAIKLTISNKFTNNGTIQSNGGGGWDYWSGGGSGGSIWVDTKTIAGSGVISTRGGIRAGNAVGNYDNSGGAGGRVAVYYEDIDGTSPFSFDTTHINAYGTMGWGNLGWSGAGTVYYKQMTGGVDTWTSDARKNGNLLIDNNNQPGSSAGLVAANYVFNQIKLNRYGHLTVEGDQNGGVLEVSDGSSLVGDATKPSLTVNGKLRYTGSGDLGVNGVDLGLNGEIEMVNNHNLVIGDSLAAGVTMYAHTWAHNKTNGYSFGDVTVGAHGIVTMVGYDNGDGDYTNDYGVSLNATNVTVASGGYINANELGYRYGAGPGVSTGDGHAASGYGGYGASNYPAGGGATYGSVYEPTDLGSRALNGGSGSGGGGGAIKLTVSNKFTNNGTIQSNGGGGWNYWSGGGSGGSIWLDTKTIAGSGVISARGGIKSSNGVGDYQGSGGSGGRIAVYYEDIDGTSPFSFDTTHINAYGTMGWGNLGWSGAGTVYYKQMTGGVDTWTSDARKNGNLLIDNNNQPGSSAGLVAANYVFNQIKLNRYGHLTVEGDQNGGVLEVSDGSSLVGDATKPSLTVNGKLRYTGSGDLGVNGVDLGINGEIEMVNNDNLVIGDSLAGGVTMYAHTWAHNKTNGYSFGDVTVGAHGIVTMVSYDNGDSDYTNDYGVSLTTNNLNVTSGGVITADGLGYQVQKGPGFIVGSVGADLYGSSYGGYGWNNFNNNPMSWGKPYGDLYEPDKLGSGTGVGRSGGAIKLVVSNTFNLDGAVTASGAAIGSYSCGRAGTGGGSIWIDANHLNGTNTGSVLANAHYENNCWNSQSSGGRVAVYYNDGNFFTNNPNAKTVVQARGVSNAGPGTVYIENKTINQPRHGDLYVDNADVAGRGDDLLAQTYTFNNVYIGKNVTMKVLSDPNSLPAGVSYPVLPTAHELTTADNPLFLWNMDETTNASCTDGRDVCDGMSVNNGVNQGTNQGPSIVDGKFGKARSFAGSQSIQFNTADIANTISVEAWVNSAYLTTGDMFVIEKAPVNTQWELFFSGGNLIWRNRWPGTGDLSYPAPSNNVWHHIAATQTGSNGKLYIDGNLVATKNNFEGIANGSGVLEVGRLSDPSWADYYFNGLMDDVAVYNRVLTDTEIKAHSLGLTNSEYQAYLTDYNQIAAQRIGTGVTMDLTGNFTLDTGAKLDGKMLGYPAATGPGKGTTGVGSSGGGGAGYGGVGGNGESDGVNPAANGGPSYGNQRYPINIGSGGGASGVGALGGAGGSAIHINAKEGLVEILGSIDMSGENGHIGSPGGGGGSAGSILIEAATCNITGSLSAVGGDSGQDIYDGGGGGGGRISVLYTVGPCNQSGAISVASGVAGSAQPGQVGTYPGVTSIPVVPTFKNQYKSDSVTSIAVGGVTQEQDVVLKASVADPEASAGAPKELAAQFEVVPVGSDFTGTNLITSTTQSYTGGDPIVSEVSVPNLTPGQQYKWRASVVNVVDQISSDWADFGNNAANAADFTVSTVQGLTIGVNKTNVQIGDTISITVTARDGSNQIDGSYTGTVHFTSSSNSAVLPSNYIFSGGDAGSHTFTEELIFIEAGTYTVTVTDTVNGSLTSTSEQILVQAPAPTNNPTPSPIELPTASPSPSVEPTPTTTPEVSPSPTVAPSPTATPVSYPESIPVPTATPGEVGCEVDATQLKCLVNVVISNVGTQVVGNKVTICWDTNISTIGYVRYGIGNQYTNSTAVELQHKAEGHCIEISDLTLDSTYSFKIIATSYAGKSAEHEGSFTIGKGAPLTGEVSECITINPGSYAFNDNYQAFQPYQTSKEASCRVKYGNDSYTLGHEQSELTPITSHQAIFDLNILNSKKDLIYEINCNIENGDGTIKQCKATGVIPASKYAKYAKQPVVEDATAKLIKEIATGTGVGAIVTGVGLALLNTLAYPRWFIYGFAWLKGRRMKRPWGVVYDEETNQPIAFAIVRLYQQGKLQKEIVTDLKGKYGFVVDKGSYDLVANCPGYEKYTSIVTINDEEDTVVSDIAMKRLTPVGEGDQPVKINQNESLQEKLANLNDKIVILGFILSLVAAVTAPGLYNIGVVAFYVAMFFVLKLINKRKDWGFVFNLETAERLPGVWVRVYGGDVKKQLDVQLTDKQGRYGFFPEPGEYYLDVQAKGYRYTPTESTMEQSYTDEQGKTLLKLRVEEGLIPELTVGVEPVKEMETFKPTETSNDIPVPTEPVSTMSNPFGGV